MYDRDGADPDSRPSMSSAGRGFGGGGMHRGFGGGGGGRGSPFGQEVNPEDLFNAFFGGGGFGGGSPFGAQSLFLVTLSLFLMNPKAQPPFFFFSDDDDDG